MDTPPGDAGATASGAPRGRCVGGGCRTGIPMEKSVAWRRGPGRPGPCARRTARAALCAALCAVLCAALCAAVRAVLCAALCAMLALCAVLCAASCGAPCAASCGALCAASFGALCAASCGALCAAPCGALCAASCGALCAVLCAGSACALSWCAVRCTLCCWCTLVLCTIRCSLCPCTRPCLTCLPCLPCGEGGGFGTATGGGGLPAPLCQQGSRNDAENILQPQSGRPLWGRGGGHLLLPGAAGSLCAHVGTRAPRRGGLRALARPAAAVPAFGRAVRASLAPAALRTPVWPVENT